MTRPSDEPVEPATEHPEDALIAHIDRVRKYGRMRPASSPSVPLEEARPRRYDPTVFEARPRRIMPEDPYR